MKLFRFLMLIIAIALGAALFVGCAATSPWQREHLSKPVMQFDHNKEEAIAREHMLGTLEGSAGGFGVGGGGCGCN
jgi:hypothetical protein